MSREPVPRPRRAVAAVGAIASILAAAVRAEPESWVLDPDLTRVHWEVRHYDASTARGRFDRLDGSLTIDRETGHGSVSVTIDTASVSTGIPVFDQVLRRPDMLATAEHPRAWFVAGRFAFEGGRVRDLRGELTLRGTSRPLALKALHFDCLRRDGLEVCGGDFEATLLRSDFGITYGLPFGADRVRLLVTVQAKRG